MRRTGFRGKAVEEFVPAARAERVLWSMEPQPRDGRGVREELEEGEGRSGCAFYV
jgi:hypothetical protein